MKQFVGALNGLQRSQRNIIAMSTTTCPRSVDTKRDVPIIAAPVNAEPIKRAVDINEPLFNLWLHFSLTGTKVIFFPLGGLPPPNHPK